MSVKPHDALTVNLGLRVVHSPIHSPRSRIRIFLCASSTFDSDFLFPKAKKEKIPPHTEPDQTSGFKVNPMSNQDESSTKRCASIRATSSWSHMCNFS